MDGCGFMGSGTDDRGQTAEDRKGLLFVIRYWLFVAD
jgi:hypothetical protein